MKCDEWVCVFTFNHLPLCTMYTNRPWIRPCMLLLLLKYISNCLLKIILHANGCILLLYEVLHSLTDLPKITNSLTCKKEKKIVKLHQQKLQWEYFGYKDRDINYGFPGGCNQTFCNFLCVAGKGQSESFRLSFDLVRAWELFVPMLLYTTQW